MNSPKSVFIIKHCTFISFSSSVCHTSFIGQRFFLYDFFVTPYVGDSNFSMVQYSYYTWSIHYFDFLRFEYVRSLLIPLSRVNDLYYHINNRFRNYTKIYISLSEISENWDIAFLSSRALTPKIDNDGQLTLSTHYVRFKWNT